MKYIILFSTLLFISCNQSEKTEKDFLNFSKSLVSKIKTKKLENINKMFNDIDVIKTINNTSDSLGFKNKSERKVFHNKFNYSRQASLYFKNISRNLNGEIKITNYFFENEQFHVIICSELKENIEGTELILIEKNNRILIDNYYSFTKGLDMKNNYIEYFLYKLHDPSFIQSNKLLDKCLNLSYNGLNQEAYELYKQIPPKHSSLMNFLAVKYLIMTKLIQELKPEEVDDIYIEILTTNYKNKGFRYNKGREYFNVFGQDSIANIYKDSLSRLIKDKFFIEKLN